MNVFNKIVVVLILLFFAAVSIIAIINEFTNFFVWSDLAQRVFNPRVTINPFVSTLALLFVLAISIFLILMEFYRRKPRVATIYKVKEGNAMITLKSVAHQIKTSIQTIEGVEDISMDMLPRSKGVISNMFVELSEDVNIPQIMQEIINMSRDIASNRLGIRLLKTNLTIVNLKRSEKPKVEKVDGAEPEEESQSPETEQAEVAEQKAEQKEELQKQAEDLEENK